ncbi:MAG TPA: SpoIID/LytB domain-containing protein, partial [Solirubrobacteraceae bacterium]|nr:SpoIID/LytB domain-containing protein [Solirubrobacteraceae bacterium]
PARSQESPDDLRAVLVGVLAAIVLLAAMLLCAGSAGAATLVIAGAGDGHGVGMSQEGALGYAEHGWSYGAILAHYYTGTALGEAPAGAKVRVLIGSTVKRLPLESYVRGVISAEMPAEWPAAALEAQAVAVRTYALTAHAGGSRFDVYSDTRSQVYRGPAAETASTNAAALATAGEIVTYGGQPAITYFFASSGGHTEDVQNAFPGAAAEPWLVGVPDPYEGGPGHSWKLSLSFAEVGARLDGLVRGAFRGIEVVRRGSSPRILTAYVLGSGGRTLTSGDELAARLGLGDTWAYFSVRRGKSVVAEPDRGGQSPPGSPPPVGPSPAGGTPPPVPAGPGGGAEGPVGTPAATRAGGVVAG